MKKLILLLIVLVGAYSASMADELQEVVYLKNGSVVRGVIIEQIPGKSLKVQTADGSIFAYDMADVEKMTKEKNIYAPKYESKQDVNSIKSGYKGFVDFGYIFDLSNYDAEKLEFMTSHGYQINPYLYFGVGLGLHYYTEYKNLNVPVFANFRANMIQGKISPFLDAKVGYSFGDVDGFYFNPSLGCRIAIGNNAGINLSLGYVLQCADIFYYNLDYGLYGVKTEAVSGISLKFGVDF